MPFTIYMVECPKGRRYIGCTKLTPEQRFRGYEASSMKAERGEPMRLGQAISLYGRDAFKVSSLAVVEVEADAAAIETLMIARYQTAQPNGFNFMKTSHYGLSRYVRAA